MTLATMIGMASRMLLARVTSEHSLAIWFCFVALTIFHIYANYKVVRCLSLSTLNCERSSILLSQFIKTGHGHCDGSCFARVDDFMDRKKIQILASAGKYVPLERENCIVMHRDCTAADVLQAFIHALVLTKLFDEGGSVHSKCQLWMSENYEALIL